MIFEELSFCHVPPPNTSILGKDSQIYLIFHLNVLVLQTNIKQPYSFPVLSRFCNCLLLAFPDLHAGEFIAILVCIPICLQRVEVVYIVPLEYIARSFSETRLVSRDIRFPWPIKSNAAFLFACLNLYFCDRRIHFRFRYTAFFINSELLPFIADLVLKNSKRKCDWRLRGRNYCK